MPVYEYICLKCNQKFTLLQSLYPPERHTECPKCSSTEIKKIMSSFGLASSQANAQAPRFSGGG